jgi:hypothetical protein
MVKKRPLHVWKQLLHIINEQDVCHVGEPDYAHLYAYNKTQLKSGPEPTSFVGFEKAGKGYGALTQGGAMEHLAHVVFGGLPLKMPIPTIQDICQNFLPHCPFSPCDANVLKKAEAAQHPKITAVLNNTAGIARNHTRAVFHNSTAQLNKEPKKFFISLQYYWVAIC